MNTHRQILMTMIAAVLIAATGIFAGCKKDEVKVKVTGVTVCPTAVMLEVGKTTTLLASVLPSNADNISVTWKSNDEAVASVTADGVVTAITVDEATITCTTNDGGFLAETTVIVNPKEDNDDYATFVPSFYYGDMIMEEENVGANKLITAKYYSENKIMLLVDETFDISGIPEMADLGIKEVSMKVDCIADMTKVEEGYKAMGETTATLMSLLSLPVKIDATFDGIGTVNMTINVSNVPGKGNLVINFQGTGTTTITPCEWAWPD